MLCISTTQVLQGLGTGFNLFTEWNTLFFELMSLVY